MNENQLHRAVWQFLKLSLPSDAFAFHPANGGYALGKRTAGNLKAMGLVAGVPDLCLVYRGQFHGIELKAPGDLTGNTMKGRGYLSPDQRECHTALRAAGAIVATCWSLEDVQRSLANWGIPLRASIGGLFRESAA